MNYRETREFLNNITEHTEQEILENIQDIYMVLCDSSWYSIKEWFGAIFNIVDRNKMISEILSNAEKFKGLRKKIRSSRKIEIWCRNRSCTLTI